MFVHTSHSLYSILHYTMNLVVQLFRLFFFFLIILRPPRSTLFPYTTLFRSNLYDGFVSNLGPYLGAFFGIFLASAMYGSLTKWYASEPRGKDDQPVPSVEKSIVAQSPGRLDFQRIIRDKGFYVARLSQLYTTLGDLLERELGTPIDAVTKEQLSPRIGLEEALRAENMLARLSKIHEYSLGKRRFLFPPVLIWKRSTRKRFEEVEDFLNKLGLTITGEGDARSMLEYRLRR